MLRENDSCNVDKCRTTFEQLNDLETAEKFLYPTNAIRTIIYLYLNMYVEKQINKSYQLAS